MDTLISSALEEICSHGPTGISLSSLWPTLTPTPSSSSLKSSVWTNLLSIPTLQFTIPQKHKNKVTEKENENGTPFITPNDTRIQGFEDAERLGVKIVAKQHLRDCFVGLYDIPSSSLPPLQCRALHRLAEARTNGITQSDLAKEFGMTGNNFFYIVRKLECRGLIVRQPAIVKMKEAGGIGGEGEMTKYGSSVTTNLMYLQRYAKHLGIQQRFEINKEERTMESMENGDEANVGGDGFSAGESCKDDVLIKDFLPAMKDICDKLEEANDKVLVISDIKRELGYSGVSGHRAWRHICHKLKDACIVEEFEAKVNGKVERCLRLLKKFSPMNFENKTFGCLDDCDKEQQLKFGRRFQQTDQLVELPLDRQIYDMIDAEGTMGATVVEVCGRLGIDKKRNYPRFETMLSRFGMHKQPENYGKTVAYRFWTYGNHNPEGSNAAQDKPKIVLCKNRSTETVQDCDHSTSEVDFVTPGKLKNRESSTELGSAEAGKGNNVLLFTGNVSECLHEPVGAASYAELQLVTTERETNTASSEITASTLFKPTTSGSNQTFPYLPLTTDGALREQRILERLQDEKFILRPELHRWLMSFEKDKCTTMDRKTIDRILNKLQQQGHCKCVHINVPVVTNCGRSRITMVVLHSSVENLSPELLVKIHDRLRSFEKQIRSQGSSRLKINESVPVLNGVMRIHGRVDPDDKAAVKSEAMRANGFVLAKMVRAKLLHIFFWSYLSSLPGWKDVISSGTHVHTYRLFALEVAMKSIPIELFLQVAGSTQKFDDMIDKCKRGLCLSDLPVEEYKCLMDTQATGRLSLIIDILRRLKLIRLVPDGHSEGAVNVPHATLRHAIELKPYVEEPLSVLATSNLVSLDLRPRIRHDFVLSNREAVDEYWKTLEYCYSAADPRAALQAFPGSAVPEVFLQRSWTSLRVMSADQRAELLKHVVKDGLNKKISYKECAKIAKDLNLTLQQVLRVYYDKHHQRLNRFRGFVNGNEEVYQPSRRKRPSSSKKRKKSLGPSSAKCARVDSVDEQLGEQGVTELPNTFDQFEEEQDLSSTGEHEDCLPEYQEDDHLETVEKTGPNEDGEYYSLISKCAFSKMMPARQSRFTWTDESDRQLLIQYVRKRAILGAKFHRIDWTTLPDLPATPKICARRIASLNRNRTFRKALMNLCTMLSERYAEQLEKTQDTSLNNNSCRVFVRCSVKEGLDRKFSNSVKHAEEAGFEKGQWDDFDDKSIKKAFEDVLLYKRMAKLEASERVGSVPDESSDLNMNVEGYNSLDSELLASSNLNEDYQNLGLGKHKESVRRSRGHYLHQKFIKLFNEGTSVNRHVHESLAVSNAVELLKLVFLSTSTAPELQNLLAETLRRYSERDLFAAFSYLREKKIMIGGNDGQPFVLSQQFLHSLSKSPFPADTGKRAAKFSVWLHEREKDLMEEEIHLTADLQCGDIFQMFALICSGELAISPCVPDKGVGEAEDLRSLKRKAGDDEFCDGDKAKKLKSLADSELISRREKGFPGIMVSVHCAAISTVNTLDLFKDGETSIGEHHLNDKSNAALGQNMCCGSTHCNYIEEIPNFGGIVPTARWSSKSPWENMAGYAEYLTSKPSDTEQVISNPELFRAVYLAIQKAGDQGLSMEEVSQIVDRPGENMVEHIIDVLHAFGQVLKVNAYDSVCVVDALYHSKYFLTSSAGFCQHLKQHSISKSLERSDDGHPISQAENRVGIGASLSSKVITSDHDVHKVTILNLPEEAVPFNETQSSNLQEICSQDEVVLPAWIDECETHKLSSSELRMPILPWINGDGTINKVIYSGLIRRVLGTVMQNPGILEDDIIHRIDVLNPQSCRSLLQLMILEKHLIVRQMCQSMSSGPPALLGSLLGTGYAESKLVYRKHFFANPMSASLL